ncbi:MAG: SoxR reducing system RseC family protein [Pseudomonadota bacterium]
MATEDGIVIRLETKTAWVKTKKSSACESCASRKSCNVMGGGDEMEVEVINSAGAAIGDQVVISFETASLLKATFLLYVFPILCMFAGAVIGQEIAVQIQLSTSVSSAVFGFLFFLISIVFIRVKANKMGRQDRYRPRIIRIKKPMRSNVS